MSLVIQNVSKKFGSFTAVDGINIDIPEGQMFGMLGANGAGKTTTFRMLIGLLQPTAGAITWKGKPIDYSRTRLIGYLPEERGLYPKLKVKEQLTYLGKLKGMTKVEIEQGLDKWLERFRVPEYKSKRVEELSKGNQQKIQFIAAVLHQPELLILDEPFSGLDPVNVELLKDSVNELQADGTTILFSSHRMEHVEELCQHLCILDKGKPVVQGELKKIKQSFGRQNVVIEADYSLDYLKELQGVVKFRSSVNGARFQVEDEQVAEALFAEVAKKGFVRKFEVEEPSLHDIFVEKVGVPL